MKKEEMMVESVDFGEHLGADKNRDDEREGTLEGGEII